MRYVILSHDWPAPHFDLMLEAADSGPMPSWRLFALPTDGAAVPAEVAPHHRAAYLTYEGPVSGGRGSVRRVEAGTYTGDVATFGEGHGELLLTPDGGTAVRVRLMLG